MTSTVNVNRIFVEICKLLKKDKLARYYGTIVLNETLLVNFCSNYDPDNIENAPILKTVELSEYDDNTIDLVKKKLDEAHKECQKHILNGHTGTEQPPTKPISVDDMINAISENETIKQLCGLSGCHLTKKKLKMMLKEKPEIFNTIKKAIENEEINNPSDEQFSDLIFNIFKMDSFKNISKLSESPIWSSLRKCLERDDIFKNVYEKIKNEHPEIITEMKEIIDIFDIEKLKELYDDIHEKLENIDYTDYRGMVDIVKSYTKDESVQSIIWKFHMTIESGLVNIDSLKDILTKIFKITMAEFVSQDLLKENDFSTLMNLITGQKKSKKKNKMNKKARSDKRIKSHRRKRKHELKKRKKK